MMKLEVPTVNMKLNESSASQKGGYTVTFKWCLAEPANANSTQAYSSSVPCTWNGSITFQGKLPVGGEEA